MYKYFLVTLTIIGFSCVAIHQSNAQAISGPATVCSNGTVYTYTNNYGGLATWTVTGGAVVGPSYGYSVNIRWTESSGSVFYTVVENVNCWWDDSQTPPVYNCDQITTNSDPFYVTSPNPGVLNSSATSCNNAIGVLTLAGNSGSVVNWEQNTGTGWSTISNTSSTYSYNVSVTTQYRVVTLFSSCTLYSTQATITVISPSVGGSISGSTATCQTPVSGTLVLSGQNGTVLKWEKNEGSGWVDLSSTGNSYPFVNVVVTTQYRAFVSNNSCAGVYSSPATVSFSPTTAGGTIAGGGTFCATASGSLTLNGHVGSVLRWEYFDGNGWLTINNTTSSLSYSGVTTSRQYRAVVKSGSCNEAYSTIATVAIDPVTQGGILAPTDGGRYVYATNASGPLTLSSPHAVVRWEKNTGAGWVAIANTTSAYSYSVSQSTSFRAVTKSGVCPEATSAQYDVHLFPIPTISPSTTQIIQLGTSFLLSVNSTYFFYQWYKDSNPIAGANSQQYTATEPGNYFVQVRGSASAPPFNSPPTLIKSVVGYYEKTLNAISQTAVLTEGIAENASLYSLAQNQVIQTISYQDGLGRNFQTIGIGQSPQGGDLISVEAHSKQGLIDSTFLPYATSTRSGLYRPNAIRGNGSHTSYATSEQYQFYQGTAKVVKDTYPYARTLYANDPTMRVTEQGAPGLDWQPGSTHTVRSVTALNNATYRVRYWKPDGTTNSNYPDNSVMVTIGTDENNNKVRTYTNALGQTVLKQVQMDETLEGVSTPWLETYYIYDQLGRLKYIVPPKAMKVLGTGATLDAKAASVNELVHVFSYDPLGRLVEKKVPGAAWQYIVYDKLDRPVLTQDGNLFATKKWRFVKYDIYNRVVYTGIYTNTTQTTRLAVQGLADASVPFYETEQASATHGYSNVAFPITGTSANVVLSVNYYDHYNFDRDVSGIDDYTYDPTHLVGQQATRSFSTRGKATGSKRVLLNASGAVTTNWITNVVFYDKYDRPIQTQTNNHLHTSWTAATLDKNTVVYDFVKSLKSKTTHFQNATTSVVLDDRNEYDPTGRVLRTYRKINGGAEQLLVQCEYNALGQVVDKKLHEKIAGSRTFLQSVDMRYNIRGWLKSINNSQLTVDNVNNTNDEADDYFGMELIYNTAEAGMGNTQYYNGNISATKWKAYGASSGAADQRSYKYLYDKSDRLKTATFQANNGVAWLKEAGTLNEAVTYDHNGNIKTLTRTRNLRGLTGLTVTSAPETFDNLTYTYASNRDRLTKLEDAATAAGGFANGVNTATEYLYNTDGSLTKDDNKGISSITYNMLGKPQIITFSGTPTKTITYTYDAAGTKLKMTTLVNSVTTNTDYVGGFVYTNNALSFFTSPEGRVVKKGSTFEYEYAITDHQGNTRVLFTSAPQAAQPTSANMEAGTNPNFQNYNNRVGFDLFDHTDAGTVFQYSQKLTGGNNAQVGLAKTYNVMAGDKVKIELFAKYFNPQSTSSNLTGFATALASAFGVSAASTGEALKAYNGLNNYGGLVAAGTAHNDNGFPKLFVNILLFDKNYVLIDAAWQQINGGEQPVGNATKLPHDYMSAELTAREPGFAYVYFSNESATLVEGYFDDVTMTYTPGNILQYNEYYPFNMNTANSWTRENVTTNNFLANGGTELNSTSALYDLEYRNYDPVLGRMNGVDPMTTKYASLTPYNFSFNDPVSFTDVNGADPTAGSLAYQLAIVMSGDGSIGAWDRTQAIDYSGWGWNANPGGYGTASGRDREFGMSMSFGALSYSAAGRAYATQMRSDAYRLSIEAYGARYGANMSVRNAMAMQSEYNRRVYANSPDLQMGVKMQLFQQSQQQLQNSIRTNPFIIKFLERIVDDGWGVYITVGYKDEGSKYESLRWVQTVKTNSLSSETCTGAEFVDPCPGGEGFDDKPFYYSDSEEKSRKGKYGFTTSFFDGPWRYSTSSETTWMAQLSLVGSNGGTYSRIATISYGFQIHDNTLTLIKPKYVIPTAFHLNSFLTQRYYP